jgi:thioredoxin-like negative regulator of GroEL
MEELAAHYEGRVKVYKVDTEAQRELAAVFQIRSIPSILFAPLDGKPAMQPGALSKEEYMKIIEEFVLKTVGQKTNQINSQKES